MLPITFVPISENKKADFGKWLSDPRAEILRDVLEARCEKFRMQAADKLIESLAKGPGILEEAKELAQESRQVQVFLDLLQDMGQGYYGGDAQNEFEYLTIKAI